MIKPLIPHLPHEEQDEALDNLLDAEIIVENACAIWLIDREAEHKAEIYRLFAMNPTKTASEYIFNVFKESIFWDLDVVLA